MTAEMFRPGKTGLLVVLLFFFFVCRGAEAFEEATVAPGTIRVGLAQQAAQVEFSIAGDYDLISVSDQKVLVSLKPGERWQAKADSGRISLFQNGRFFQSFTGPLQMRSRLSRAAVLAGSGELRNLSPGEEMIVLGAGGRTSPMDSDLSGLHVLSAQGLAP
ncbi:MAG: hypothetical protein AB1652_07385, partial [Bacillota bacterium]